MEKQTHTRVRKGRFLWMEPIEQHKYLGELRTKIEAGHFYSDLVIGKIVEEIAPVFSDSSDLDSS
ncbi:hypothetical protein QA601_05640 [Chitinispirillales bacterium ANBcel5]|uniref:hypothetical protein n=1 Tax=Cellulosispirillum alkaliphilum TaxID=3039283 RepID=UPI002A52B21C|nr:hypothetical protein [Chitinispirillales bacterium ANBcel5]